MENLPEMKLGKFISNRRKTMALTQEELADRLHVSKSAIAKWETDRGIPDRENIKKLAKVLNINVESIYRFTEAPEHIDPKIDSCITADLIAVLQSYGYEIIPPTNKRDESIGENYT